MTDQQWNEAMAEIQSLRFRITHNIMPVSERHAVNARLSLLLRHLADVDMWRLPGVKHNDK